MHWDVAKQWIAWLVFIAIGILAFIVGLGSLLWWAVTQGGSHDDSQTEARCRVLPRSSVVCRFHAADLHALRGI